MLIFKTLILNLGPDRVRDHPRKLVSGQVKESRVGGPILSSKGFNNDGISYYVYKTDNVSLKTFRRENQQLVQRKTST